MYDSTTHLNKSVSGKYYSSYEPNMIWEGFRFVVVKSLSCYPANLIPIPLALVDWRRRQTEAFLVLFTTTALMSQEVKFPY